MANEEVILTGLRANGEFHLGNYLGGILPMVQLQQKFKDNENYQINMFIPDLHSFTTEIDHSKLYEQIMTNLKVFLAAGLEIDHPRTYIYRQSRIPAHSELTVILNNFAYFGELRRMTQFKEKSNLGDDIRERVIKLILSKKSDEVEKIDDLLDSKSSIHNLIGELKEKQLVDIVTKLTDSAMGSLENQVRENLTAGLFDYPVLMAADILLYGAKYVPVGDDQKQHLELTRDLAQRINNKFEDKFPEGVFETVPVAFDKQLEFYNRDNGVRIRSLRHPENKMSKSIQDPAGTIMLSDPPEEVREKIMSATTDSLGEINFDFEKQPGVANLLQILALLSGRSQAEVVEEHQGQNQYSQLKELTAEKVHDFLTDFQKQLSKIDEKTLQEKLKSSEAEMKNAANATLGRVQQAVGIQKRE